MRKGTAMEAEKFVPTGPLDVSEFAGRHPSTVAMLATFRYGHLPLALQRTSRPCAELAFEAARRLPDGPELTAGLRKLREAKDCFVVAAVQAAG